MTINRKTAAGAVAASLAGGGLAGALLFAPTTSGAQEDGGPTDSTAPEGAEARQAERGQKFASIADLLGITTNELREALRDGQTIADLAEANDVDPQTIVDQLVADMTEKLEARIAELPERMEDLVNGEADLGRRLRHRHAHRHFDGPGGGADEAPAEDGELQGS